MLEALITSALRRKILALFFTNAGTSFHLREVCRRTDSPTNAVGAELGRLERAGILESSTRGRMKLFTANKFSPVYKELRGLILKSEGIVPALQGALRGLRGVRFAFVYGSFARGGERPGSDIDLMVIGAAQPGEAYGAARAAEKRLGREVSCAVYPEKEFLAKRKGGFLSEVLKAPKLWVIGDEHEFERFVEAGTSKKS